MGVRLDADGHPDQDRCAAARSGGDRGEPVDLLERVDDDPADAVVDGRFQLSQALVVAVHADPGTRHTGADGDRKLAATAHVEEQAIVADPPGDLGAQECLAGVIDVGAAAQAVEDLGVGADELRRAPAEIGLVDDCLLYTSRCV